MPFWADLILQFEKNDYGNDVWEWIRNREVFQKKCADHGIISIDVLNVLAPEILKRRPYWDKTLSDRMPESLSPAAFALRHAALEAGVRDTYEALKKKVAQQGKQKRTARKSRTREIKK